MPRNISRGLLAGRTFPTEYAYRRALAQARGFPSRHAYLTRSARATTSSEIAALSARQQEARGRALSAVAWLRRNPGAPLQDAAESFATTVANMKRYAGAGLQTRAGRVVGTTPYDRLPRPMRFIVADSTRTGAHIETLTIRDSRSASRMGRYWNAVKLYARTGDARALRPFRGKSVRVEKRAYPFITDTRVLDRLAQVGELSFDDIYQLIT